MKQFHYRQYADLAALCDQKVQAGKKISVVIPTLNEAATIGPIVTTIRERLNEHFPLVDEIVVIDSGSSDDTCSLARAAGAAVHSAQDIAKEYGHIVGKGENLWKSLFVTCGDITVFVDGDILDFHEGYIAGLVGPLLGNQELQYVKAFYRRPLFHGPNELPQGGGRVSEILIRPLFALFYPALGEFMQPLAGEYAVRRNLLERLPFPPGYAVETSHLIDVYQQFGMEVFAQCDLDSRRHRNRDIVQLGAMAHEILKIFMIRVERDGMLEFSKQWQKQSASFDWMGGQYSAMNNILELGERPPYHTLQHPSKA